MIVVDTLAEMRKVLPPCACEEMAALMAEFAVDGEGETASFTELYGGTVQIVERVSDLDCIMTLEMAAGRELSLLQAASHKFDVAEWICGGAWARFVLIDNALGGPQFFVPASVATQCPFVTGSIVSG